MHHRQPNRTSATRHLHNYGVHLCEHGADHQRILHKTCSETGNISVARNIKPYHDKRHFCYKTLISFGKKSVREVTAVLDNRFVSNEFWEQLSAAGRPQPSLSACDQHLDRNWMRRLPCLRHLLLKFLLYTSYSWPFNSSLH